MTELSLQGTVFLDRLVELGTDLIEDPEANPEYTRGVLELLHDATGFDVDELRAHMFPVTTPLMQYAIEVIGGQPEDIADWQRVAQELIDEREARANLPDGAVRRTVTFYEKDGDEHDGGYYRYQYDVIMDWVKDEDQLDRSEVGHGETQGEAWAMALRIAAAFMYEDHVDGASWPDNKIDHLDGTHMVIRSVHES